MQVKDVMSRDVETAGTDSPMAAIAKTMGSHDIGLLPVCDGNRVAGMLSDRDITIRVMANNLHPEQLRCRDIMTPNVVFCFEDHDLDEARKLMQQHKIRRLPVLNRQRSLVGIVALSGIALGRSDCKSSGIALQEVSIPDAPKPLPGQKRE